MYTITLQDGTKLENLELNGNNYIAQTAINSTIFDNNLGSIVISDSKNELTYANMKLISNIVRDGRSWLVFGEKSKQEIENENLQKQLLQTQLALTEIYEMMLASNANTVKKFSW